MNALLKTLFGDGGTVAVAAIVIAAEVLLVANGEVAFTKFAIPWLVLAGTAWVATR